jgi:lysozyme
MKTSSAGLQLIVRFEGVRLKAYDDGVGVWTIGVGHTGPDVQAGS